MIVLTTSAGQTLKFIPRDYPNEVVLEFTDEDTNTTNIYSLLTTRDRYYLEVLMLFSPVLKEGTFYNLKVIGVGKGNVIYRDRIFCTDQTPPSSYTINKGEYVEHATTNEYIVL